VPQAIASIMTRRTVRPSRWKQQRRGIAEEFRLLGIADLADVAHIGMAPQQRLDLLAPIVVVDLVDLGAMRSSRPLRTAISMARSGRFSGEMRPRKAR